MSKNAHGLQRLCKPIRVLVVDYSERGEKICVICARELQPISEMVLDFQSTGETVCKISGGGLTKERYANVSTFSSHGFLGF